MLDSGLGKGPTTLNFCRLQQHVHGECKEDDRDRTFGTLLELVLVRGYCSRGDFQAEVGKEVQNEVS